MPVLARSLPDVSRQVGLSSGQAFAGAAAVCRAAAVCGTAERGSVRCAVCSSESRALAACRR